MKTLNQEQLLFISGGNDEHIDCDVQTPENDEVVEVVPEVHVEDKTGFFQAASAFLAKLSLGCC